jgi:hypothetical protein
MALVQLYLMTSTRIARLERFIEFARVPCVGEWLRFESGGLLPHKITEVTHDEQGNVEVSIGAQRDESGGCMLHESDEDLRRDIDDRVAAGWILKSEAPNHLLKKDA